jgi:NADH:ubiquinone oxidoreductase subunit C
VDTSDLIPKLEAALPGSVLEMRPFGRSGEISLWIEMKSVAAVARLLRDDPAWGLDFLENLAVMEMEGSLVLTYFVRSTVNDARLILRGTLAPEGPEAPVDAASVIDAWPMARAQEGEIADLFGVRFTGHLRDRRAFVPIDWVGYPLRKSYVFPVEYGGVSHMRPAASTAAGEGVEGDYGLDGTGGHA